LVFADRLDALGRKDLDARWPSTRRRPRSRVPLVRHLLGTDTGIIEGREELRAFVEEVFERTPDIRTAIAGASSPTATVLDVEYPRRTPGGEQIDLVETMELKPASSSITACIGAGSARSVLEDDGYRREPQRE